MGIHPVVRQIDPLAAEYPAQTNYLYLTFNGEENDVQSEGDKSVLLLGSGAYRIGSSVEFDWCCVNASRTLRKLGYRSILLNFNPETVSTDYDICDRLYFDEISLENVLDIYAREQCIGVIISVGGQTPNNLALQLHHAGLNILGTSAIDIDRAEDRHKFSKLLDSVGVDQPPWREAPSLDDAVAFAQETGYPVLLRPSYVLSGAAMGVATNARECELFLNKAADVSPKHPVVVSKFFEDSNLRASRSFPFVSKICKVNFIELATKAILDVPAARVARPWQDLDHVGVKAPHFSFMRLQGADPTLGVEMASTGEVGCLGDDFEEAFLKALISVGFKFPIR